MTFCFKPSRGGSLSALFFFTAILWGSDRPVVSPIQLYKDLSEAGYDGRSIEIENLVLVRDVHRFTLKKGAVHFLAPVAGKTFGAVFEGDGVYRLSPATENERNQLALSSNQKDLEAFEDEFDGALFFFTDNTFEQFTEAGPINQGSDDEKLKVLKNFEKVQRKTYITNFNLRLAQAFLNGGKAEQGLFLAFMKGKKISSGIAAVDPLGADALRLSPSIRLGSEASCLFVADKSDGGYWYQSHIKPEVSSGAWKTCRTEPYVDALHYKINTTLKKQNLSGTTRIEFKVLNPSLNMLPLFLTNALRLSEVRLVSPDGASRPVSFVQDLDLGIFFRQPLIQGETYALELDYSGDEVLFDIGFGRYIVTSRTEWYPNLGAFGDRATFELSYACPKSNQVLSVGKLVEERVEDGQKISVWKSEEPLTVVGFNYGEFLAKQEREEKLNLDLIVSYGVGAPENLVHNVMADTINSVRLYSHFFGALPYTSLAVTEQPQAWYGQAWPTLIFLPAISFINGTTMAQFARGDSRMLIEHALAPHEIAHQWWGHQITAKTYRDQWLEEGFAEFSAGLLIQQTQGWEAGDAFWRIAEETILRKGSGGRLKNYEVGPISQGWRLATQRSRDAYSAIIYSKGGFVVHMLRMMMWDPREEDPDRFFIAMMRDYYQTHGGNAISTPKFQESVEKFMLPHMDLAGNQTMDWFFDQWVYGTEIPSYKNTIKIKQEGKGKYRLKGKVTQEGVSEGFRMLVPLYADFGKGRTVRFGVMPFSGNMSRDVDVVIPMPNKPKKIVLNAHHDVLAQ